MDFLVSIPIDKIDTAGRIREPDPAQVEALSKSILEIGLLNPVTVCQKGDRFRLVAGGNRIEACRLAGYAEVTANVLDLTDPEAIIAECDENLHGTNLSPAERALFTVCRKQAYEQIHPETRAGTAGAVARWDATDKLSTASFAEATAAATGKDERTVRRDAERGSKVIPEAMSMIKGTALDTGTYLDKIKNQSPNEQVFAVNRDLKIQKEKDAARAQGGIAHRIVKTDTQSSEPTGLPSLEDFIGALRLLGALKTEDYRAICPNTKELMLMRSLLATLIGTFEQVLEGITE